MATAAFVLFAASERSARPVAQALADIERILELAGYGLTQVSLTGHRFTPDRDIFDALDLRATPTLLSFDIRAAQDRIERLPWIARASIGRALPDRLEVRVSERAPFAVWRQGERDYLIDKSGRVLAPVRAAAAPPSLPRVAGDDAATEAAALFELLAAHPAMQRKVEVAERIGGRRWTLHLAGGGSIELPAEGAAEALVRASLFVVAGGSASSEIDLRVAGRTLLRSAQARSAMVQPPDPQLATGGI